MMRILDPNSKDIVEDAEKAILQGKVLALPTDTVYGLLVDGTRASAVKKIFQIKKRKMQKALALFVRDIKMAKGLAKISSSQERFLKKVWPGKVTVVLKQQEDCPLPKVLFGKSKVIGLRIPDHKLVKAILKKVNRPLAESSANISGRPALLKAKEVLDVFSQRKFQPDFVLAGSCRKPCKPSTVIDLSSGRPKILRKGAVPAPELLKILNRLKH